MRNDELSSLAIGERGVVMANVGQVFGFAELLSRTGMLPKGVNAEQAVVSIIAGAPLGLNPFQAVQGIAAINGRPTLWGDAMVAVVKASGLLEDEKVEKFRGSDGSVCGVRVSLKRRGVENLYVGEFSKSMAERAGLWGKSGPWSAYPERMLLSRARAFAYRDGFADVLRGMRSAEEERDVVESEVVPVASAVASAPRRRVRACAAEILKQEGVKGSVVEAEVVPVASADAKVDAKAGSPTVAPAVAPAVESADVKAGSKVMMNAMDSIFS